MMNKQNISINFAGGLDTKTDPWAVQPGNFLSLENSIFTKAGLLQKRNGFGLLATAPTDATSVTTFGGNLTAIGNSVYAYNADSEAFVNKGKFQPLSLDTLSLVKNSLPQTECEAAIAPNGAVCVSYIENNNGTSSYKYAVVDGSTGQVLLGPTAITPTSGATTGPARIFILGSYFVIVFTATITAADHLQYIPISWSTFVIGAAVNITSTYTKATTVSWDGVVTNNKLYLAWNVSGGGGIDIITLSSNLSLSSPLNKDATHQATMMSVCTDDTTIFVFYYNLTGTVGYVFGVDQNGATLFTPQQWINTGTILNIASAAVSGVATLFYEVSNTYSYDGAIHSNYTSKVTCTNLGVVGSPAVFKRSVGLASKAFMIDGTIYVLCTYSSPSQPTYFLIDGSGYIVAELAYQNGGGYLTTGLPSVSVSDNVASIPYLYKDFVASQNKGATNAGQTSNIYFQTGVNLASFTIGDVSTQSVEIAKTLNLTGGFLWTYDGSSAFENGFFLYPDSIEATWSATGGSIVAQPDGATNTAAYWYQVTYEWTDNQGNRYRSAPSIPISVTTTGSGTAGSITVNIPTLRLSYKTNVTICIYRWSVAQQVFYQTTSISLPTLNDPTTDSIAYVDTHADATILGNTIIYTNGGVIEDTATPSPTAITLFDNRVWMVDGEDQNLLWFSKTVIENVPVEMSDLLTLYISPTQSAQGPTGPITAIAPLDDKLIIMKKDALYYLNGSGPDNTGSNSQYSQPIFVTSTVGCAIPESIVFIPDGLMFQSDKGIWLLGRNLETVYIGAPVEGFTSSATVNSAQTIPSTNQVRFTLSSGLTLMYDYFYKQWGSFANVPALSSTIYQSLHTLLTPYDQIQQETPSLYLDGTSPVQMSFTTGWFSLAGLQGYQRSYFFYLLGQYLTPHKLAVSIAYDFNPSPQQLSLIEPTNYGGFYGGTDPNPEDGTDQSSPYGQDPTYGGTKYVDSAALANVEQWRVFLAKQRCQSFQLTVQEIYDASFGVAPGAGLTLSGINLVFGVKKGFRPISAANSIGGGGNNL